MSTSLVWFRLDLRLADNPALAAAIARGKPVVPVYVWAPEAESPWAPGPAARCWLHFSLVALDRALRKCGSRLVIRQGEPARVLRELAKETGADAVYWNRRYEPALVAQEAAVEHALCEIGVRATKFNSALLHEPEHVSTVAGSPFKVFTAFWNRCLAGADPPIPIPPPARIPAPRSWPRSLPIAELGLITSELQTLATHVASWAPGEAGAVSRLNGFLESGLERYDKDRDRVDLPSTSRLSPHLHFGELGPRQVWHAVRARMKKHIGAQKSWRRSRFLTELGWREFAHYVLNHNPHAPGTPLRQNLAQQAWRVEDKLLSAWQAGQTGYPIVDAAMRELQTTGWIHNRLRMIVASFLVKDLMIPWQLGARWFWLHLIDADLANNTLGWQWCAGCGVDALPFTRVFNPILQGERHDPLGQYVRKWCPELAALPARWIHKPWLAPVSVLSDAGVVLGRMYPRPVVDHRAARLRTLALYSRARRRSGTTDSSSR